jgi:hypothetical protein
MGWATFWAIFSKTHLVTLMPMLGKYVCTYFVVNIYLWTVIGKCPIMRTKGNFFLVAERNQNSQIALLISVTKNDTVDRQLLLFLHSRRN